MSWRWARRGTVPGQVLAFLAISLLAVACTTAPSGPRYPPLASAAMRLTGYRYISLAGTSGAVTVGLTPADSLHIVGLLKALRAGPGADCIESAELIYQVVVRHEAGYVSGTVISGFRCGGAVSVTPPGSIPSWYTDAHCHLYQAIRRLVPARAAATRQEGIGCG